MDASIRLEHTLLAVEREHRVHAMLELGAPAAPASAGRAPLSVALVVDRSGSMAGPKLETARRCAAWLARRLAKQDRLAVVAYDDQVDLAAALGPVGPDHHGAIAGIRPGGMTNLSGGWLKGVEQLRGGGGAVRKVLLLTDGLANIGITDPRSLVALAAGAAREGVTTATIGFGHGFDEDLLTSMADAGGGDAHYAETPDGAPAIFAAELGGLTSLVAQNVSVEVRPAAPVQVVGILNEYPAVPVAGGVQVQLGDAYAGDRRRVVLELHVPHLAGLGPVRIADLVVRYTSVGEQIAQTELTVPVVANAVSPADAAAAGADPEVREEVLLLTAARAHEAAIRHADHGDYDAARRSLGSALTHLRAAPGLVAEARTLEERLADMAPGAWDAGARKRHRYGSHEMKRRRGGGGGPAAGGTR